MTRGQESSASTAGVRRYVLLWGPTILALVVYANSLPGDFVLDDVVLVERDPGIRDFDLDRIFGQNYWGSHERDFQYRPLTLVSFALNHSVSSAAWGFHLVNVMLNALVVLLFHRVCRHLFESPVAAFLAAALFAVMPIHTEAVANIVGRAELLAALAIFGACLVAARGSRSESWRRAASVALLVFVGMFAKENTATAAALAPLVLYFKEFKEFKEFRAFKEKVIAWRTAALSLLAVGAYYLCRQLALGDYLESLPPGTGIAGLLDNPLAVESAPVRILNGVVLAGVYVWKTLVPVHLAADYSYNQIPVLELWSWKLWLGVLAVVGGSVALIVAGWRRAPLISLGTLFFLVALSPVANVILPIGTIFAERLAYTPSAGIAIALVAAADLWSRRARRTRSPFAALPHVLLAIVVALYAGRTVDRNLDWSDRIDWSLRVAEDSPASARSHHHAAEGHLLRSRQADSPRDRERHLAWSEKELARALQIYPSYARAQAFLGEVLLERSKYSHAVAALERASELFRARNLREPPELDKLKGRAHAYVAMAAKGQEGGAEAVRDHFRAALGFFDRYLATHAKDLPVDTEALRDRAMVRGETGDTDGALADLDAAIAARADLPDLYQNRGYLRFRSGDIDGALDDYRKGLELCEEKGWLLTPANRNAFLFRAYICDVLIRSDRLEVAAAELEKLRAMNPRSSSARGLLEKLEASLERGRSRRNGS